MEQYFKSVLDMDRAAVVLCDLNHTIVYMNDAAKENYKKWGGDALLGQNLLDCHNNHSREMIKKIIDWFLADDSNNMIYTSKDEKKNKDVYMVALRDENNKLIGYYEKHEYRNSETAHIYDFSQSLR